MIPSFVEFCPLHSSLPRVCFSPYLAVAARSGQKLSAIPSFVEFCPLHSSLPRVCFSPYLVVATRSGRLRIIQRVPTIRGAAIFDEVSGVNAVAQATLNGSAEQVRERNGGLSMTELVLPQVGKISRVTKETSVDVRLNLDGTGICNYNTGIPFLDHMLDQLASHGLLDVEVTAKGRLRKIE